MYRNHEARAWIYKVSKLLPRPRITFKRGSAGYLRVTGKGFRFNSHVTLYYHQAKRGTCQGRRGRLVLTRGSRLPTTCSSRYWLVATDDFGNYASSVGLEPTLRNRRARRRIAQRVRREEGREPRDRRRPAGHPEPLRVELDMPKAVAGRVRAAGEGAREGEGGSGRAVAQSHLFFQIFSQDGKTPVRWRERVTNTLGTAYLQVAALELPGFYKLTAVRVQGQHTAAR